MRTLLLTFLIFTLALVSSPLFAANEDLKTTTYYPSPEGEYQNLRSEKMEVAQELKVAYGNVSSGNVLTSNGTGVAKWQAIQAGKPRIVRYASAAAPGDGGHRWAGYDQYLGIMSGSKNVGYHDICLLDYFIEGQAEGTDGCGANRNADGTWTLEYVTAACGFSCLTWS